MAPTGTKTQQATAPPSFGTLGGPTGAGGLAKYLTTSTLIPTPTRIHETPIGELGSPVPAQMVSAWGLPQKMGALQLPTGTTTTVPATQKVQTGLQRGMQMLQLYGAFESGKPLTPAEMKMAEGLGGEIARAAELIGTATPVSKTPERTATGGWSSEYDSMAGQEKLAAQAKKRTSPAELKARTAANEEIAKRLTGLGLTVGRMYKNGKLELAVQIPKKLATQMQNAGYGVTSKMTLEQAINAMSGVGKTAEVPTPMVSKPVTVAQYIQGLTSGAMSRTDITKLQRALFTGGFYDQEYTDGTRAYTRGQLTSGTILAFRTAILKTLTDNKNGKPVTLEQVIKGGYEGTPAAAKTSHILGIGATGSAGGKLPTTPVPTATPEQLQGTLESTMERYLGRLPTSSELKQFTDYYSQLMAQGSKTLVEEGEAPGGTGYVTYQTGVPYLPKVPTASQAAEQWAQNTNPIAYQGHNIANAFGMLMNLIDRQNVSAYTTVGTRTGTVAGQ